VLCSGEGVVTRRSRISRPSVVGRMMSALCTVASRASTRAGVSRLCFHNSAADSAGRLVRSRYAPSRVSYQARRSGSICQSTRNPLSLSPSCI
jgi:hypothetical protein